MSLPAQQSYTHQEKPMFDAQGCNIFVFLNEQIKALSQEKAEMANQLMRNPPSTATMPEFISRMTFIREGLSRYDILRDKLQWARLNGKDLYAVLEASRNDLLDTEKVFKKSMLSDFCFLDKGLANTTLYALVTIRHELERFLGGPTPA